MSLFSNSNFVLGHRASQHWASLTFFLALWIIAELLRNERLTHSRTSLGSPSRLTLLEVTKLTISVGVYLWRRRHGGANTSSTRRPTDVEGEEEMLYGLSPDGSQTSGRDSPPIPVTSHGSLRVSTGRSTVCLSLLAALYSLRDYLALASGRLADPFALYLAIPFTTVFSIIAFRLCFSRSFSAGQCQAVLLQLCGIFIVRGHFNQDFSRSSFSIFFALALSGTLALVSNEFIYKLHDTTSINTLNITLFASGTIISGLLALIHSSGAINQPFYSAFPDLLSIVLLLAEAGRDIATLSVLFHFDAVSLGVASTLGLAIVLAVSASIAMLSSVIIFIGCFVVFVGSASYMFCHRTAIEEGVESNFKSERIRSKISIISIVFGVLFVVFTAFHEGIHFVSYTPSLWDALKPQSDLPNCQRKPLASLSYYSQTRRYHEFDNILLIVFFSHPRYNVNLDNYKQVYSEYFPNMIFIGPASREDAGFSHSYDVIVDSYQSKEDLKNVTHYKMAGRMAHHMLYTAMMQHDCYDGYLWTPFDTLLNVPRLQQFDQRFFWYHSPWGKFVPNPAFPHAKDNMDKARHAPPANISPDPQIVLTETWRGWQQDWWWGDPHVGVGVCMTAFQRVPLNMRERMAEFTDGKTRFIGGSADTLYIPGRHRQKFMDTLELFLETDCFLEIATPTTVHLVVPPQEPILFVDHWWIWEPPFNASFVRQKWAEGREVDTFHTFHWGDKGTDGVWREDSDSIDDVRGLLQESATRQKVDFPSS